MAIMLPTSFTLRPTTSSRSSSRRYHHHRPIIRISGVSILIILTLIGCFALKLTKVLRHHSKTLRPLFPKPNTEQYRIRPLACSRFLKAVKNGHASIKDPNHGEVLLAGNKTANSEPFVVSIPKPIVGNANTKGLSILKSGTYYQQETTKLYKRILQKRNDESKHQSSPQTPSDDSNNNNSDNNNNNNSKDDHQSSKDDQEEESHIRVVEVGASFGWWSLLAQSLGYHVDVFEPNLVNSIRLCQSIQHNRLEEGAIDIFPYAMTDEDQAVLIQYKDDGTARINDNWGHKSQAFALDTFGRERGWLERNDQIIEILKIDVGHYAPHVISGASELLQSGMVKHVLLDLTILRHERDRKAAEEAIRQLQSSSYELELWGDKEATNPNPWLDNVDLPATIIRTMVDKTNGEMSLMWKLKQA